MLKNVYVTPGCTLSAIGLSIKTSSRPFVFKVTFQTRLEVATPLQHINGIQLMFPFHLYNELQTDLAQRLS